jgi:septal ring factor EnvC (AmiA/AmiB activator)
MISLLSAIAAALGGACGPRPTHHTPDPHHTPPPGTPFLLRAWNLHSACAAAKARAADPGVADDARALLEAHREIARLREELDKIRTNRDSVDSYLQGVADGRAKGDRIISELHATIARRITERDEAAKGLRDLLEPHRCARESLADTHAALDTLTAEVARHKAARKRAGRMVSDLLLEVAKRKRHVRELERLMEKTARLLREALAREEGEAKRAADALDRVVKLEHALDAEMRARAVEVDRLRDERDAAVAALASTRAALAALPVHLRAAVRLSAAGWEVNEVCNARLGVHRAEPHRGYVVLLTDDRRCVDRPYTNLPAPTPNEHPALAVIRRAVAGEVLP